MFNPETIKKDFPIFENQPDLVYLDSAATALKPKVVVDAMNAYYEQYSANASRGLYPLAECATTAFEEARKKVAHFIHAEHEKGVIFTANATHAINIVALGLEETIESKNNIIVTALEHHSNYLPWKDLAERRGSELRTVAFTEDGIIDIEKLTDAVDENTAIVALSAVSNVLGIINPVTELVQSVRAKNPRAFILIDACQAIGHFPVDIQAWGADFVVFSGHKVLGPTGVGVLTGEITSLEKLIPKNVGGGTVLDACSPETEYKKLPENLEGGTPNLAGAIGLGRAIEYFEDLGLEDLRVHEVSLMEYTLQELQKAFGKRIHILGTLDAAKRAGLISFTLDGIHPHDLAHLLGEMGICVRAGEHCASPLHHALGLPATTRISLALYNTESDIDRLIEGIQKALTVLG